MLSQDFLDKKERFEVGQEGNFGFVDIYPADLETAEDVIVVTKVIFVVIKSVKEL